MTYDDARRLPTPVVLFSDRQMGRIVEWWPEHRAVDVLMSDVSLRRVGVQDIIKGKFCALAIVR